MRIVIRLLDRLLHTRWICTCDQDSHSAAKLWRDPTCPRHGHRPLTSK